jgi:hypothetical protein
VSSRVSTSAGKVRLTLERMVSLPPPARVSSPVSARALPAGPPEMVSSSAVPA